MLSTQTLGNRKGLPLLRENPEKDSLKKILKSLENSHDGNHVKKKKRKFYQGIENIDVRDTNFIKRENNTISMETLINRNKGSLGKYQRPLGLSNQNTIDCMKPSIFMYGQFR